MMEHFINGFMETPGNSYEIAYLVQTKKQNEFTSLFQNAEQVMLAFPLYTDAMPGIVKTFIESLEPFCNREGNPGLGFLVQSGFPESLHCQYVARYLEKLAKRLDSVYHGTIIKGGGEVRGRPAWMSRKLFTSLTQLGQTFGKTRVFDDNIVKQLSKTPKMIPARFSVFRFVANTMYWNPQLRKNKAYEKRFAMIDIDQQ
jgi:hypothetical protein